MASRDDQMLAITGGGFCGDNRLCTFGGEFELVRQRHGPALALGRVVVDDPPGGEPRELDAR